MLFSTTGQAHAIVLDPKSSESQITEKIDALVDTGYDLNDPVPVTPFDSKTFTKWKEGAEVLNVEEIHPTVVYKTAVIEVNMTLWEAIVCRVKQNAENIQKLQEDVKLLLNSSSTTNPDTTDQTDTVVDSDAEPLETNSGE